MSRILNDALLEAQTLLFEFRTQEDNISAIEDLCTILTSTLKAGKNIFVCGNGGSHADALHFSEELTGRFRSDRRPLGCLALGEATHVTCVGNDFGFRYIFERQLRGLARPGDVLMCLSTSGRSENILLALQAAKEMSVQTVGLYGNSGGTAKAFTQFSVLFPGRTADRTQELQKLVLHCVVQEIEARVFNL